MEKIEVSFQQAHTYVKDTASISQLLLSLAVDVIKKRKKLPLRIKDLSKDVFELLEEKDKSIVAIKSCIREHLLYTENEQLQINYLFLTLKLYGDVCSQFQALKTIKEEAAALFCSHISGSVQTGFSKDQIFANGDVINTLADIPMILAYILSHTQKYQEQILDVISVEYSLTRDDISNLLQGSPEQPRPVPLHQFKKQLNRNTRDTSLFRPKLVWLGTLKQFAELIVTLEHKGWIKSINHGEIKATAEALTAVIDISKTKATSAKGSCNSLIQYLKPSERESKLFTKRYYHNFYYIEENEKNGNDR